MQAEVGEEKEPSSLHAFPWTLSTGKQSAGATRSSTLRESRVRAQSQGLMRQGERCRTLPQSRCSE